MVRTLALLAWLAGFGLVSQAEELTLHFIRSPEGLNWRRPSDIARSIILNETMAQVTGKGHSAGHVYVELVCGSRQLMTGMTNSDDAEMRRVVFTEQRGLGALFFSFRGRLQETDEVRRDLEPRLSEGSASFVTFKINAATCSRLLRYVSEFKEFGYDRFYGLPNRPLYGEGAGCSAFGESFLEVAGLVENELVTSWSRDIRVPQKLIGSPGHKVNFLALMSSTEGWAREKDLHQALFFWDPELMDLWVKEIWRGNRRTALSGVEKSKRGESRGLIVHREDWPTPAGPIWKIP